MSLPPSLCRLSNEDGGLDRSLGAEGGSITATAVLEPWGSGMLATSLKCYGTHGWYLLR